MTALRRLVNWIVSHTDTVQKLMVLCNFTDDSICAQWWRMWEERFIYSICALWNSETIRCGSQSSHYWNYDSLVVWFQLLFVDLFYLLYFCVIVLFSLGDDCYIFYREICIQIDDFKQLQQVISSDIVFLRCSKKTGKKVIQLDGKLLIFKSTWKVST